MSSDDSGCLLFSISSELDISTWIGSAGRYNGPLLPQPDKFKADTDITNSNIK